MIKKFSSTSKDPYTRHYYRYYLTNNQAYDVHDYDTLIGLWISTPYNLRSHIEILDYETRTKKSI